MRPQVSPDVMYNGLPWPDEEFTRVTVERDLKINITLTDHPILWKILWGLAEARPALCYCSVLLRASLAVQVSTISSKSSSSELFVLLVTLCVILAACTMYKVCNNELRYSWTKSYLLSFRLLVDQTLGLFMLFLDSTVIPKNKSCLRVLDVPLAIIRKLKCRPKSRSAGHDSEDFTTHVYRTIRAAAAGRRLRDHRHLASLPFALHPRRHLELRQRQRPKSRFHILPFKIVL